MSSNLHIQAIVQSIKAEEQSLRSQFPILAYQNMLGLSLLMFAVLAMLLVAGLYAVSYIPAWLCIVLIAFITSISHEIEHDLIHKLYFKRNPVVHNLMMLIVWLMRPNTINPWYRRKIHLHHHKVSGTNQDLEERLVGNGIKNPALRVVSIVDGLLGLIISHRAFKREITGFRFLSIFNAGFPIATVYFGILYGFIIFHSIDGFLYDTATHPTWLIDVMKWVDFLMVVLIAPNIIRSSSLNLVTSSMHYYGGVGNLMQQTQVLNHWVFFPFQLFCFNFGNTHTIHHFLPNQPFYIRQMISGRILPVMKHHGVRFNDIKSIKQANFYSASGLQSDKEM
ncbi:fatty acid desaturase [Pseudoalteromonas sp. MMG013]|uniref:fatty acid desaturase n=1 Tax=Pseudoalteromonas sp. MMG013 TaxID=2822687 RepID=UPI001B3885BE|nr:fatty acid desaturase [Pseudoalteromonas sp. MMG013]MBQ4863292.1 fatty acid desaturase [Pseudoalteromonas sp. MMG013]